LNTVDPFDLVIFGGTGDLATRKLIPALYHRHCAGQLPDGARVIALGRKDLGREAYLNLIMDKSGKAITHAYFDAGRWQRFVEHVDYLQLDAASEADFSRLADYLGDASQRRLIFYLSTSPDLFAGICQGIAGCGLARSNSRVVLEKPLGRDLRSAEEINTCVEAAFGERQIYRIDHYLGKEAVQNLLALRFGNSIFEPMWGHGKIRDVQITLAEQIGVEGRAEFYDSAGALRDMVQNHLMQLLCIIAMEPPISMDADNVRDEKLKVIRSLEPITGRQVERKVVRGQYAPGPVSGNPVAGYTEETGIDSNSHTETFVALKANINNWRWAGVPFYLRTGKRMHEQVSEVVINFSGLPHTIYPASTESDSVNRLYIRLQPHESIELHLMAKQAGDQNTLKPIKLDLELDDAHERNLDAYERLLMDVVRGNQTLFVRRDELNAAWRWIDPIMDVWQKSGRGPERYTAGTSGPEAARELLARDGRVWIEEV
jgi:glucose-6-phosphate 1-dehydrogenase